MRLIKARPNKGAAVLTSMNKRSVNTGEIRALLESEAVCALVPGTDWSRDSLRIMPLKKASRKITGGNTPDSNQHFIWKYEMLLATKMKISCSVMNGLSMGHKVTEEDSMPRFHSEHVLFCVL